MWIYKGQIIESAEDLPRDVVGFIYVMTNKESGRRYIGKKYIYSERKKSLTKKEIALLENKRLKKWKTVITESDWLTYTSSSKDVNEEIKNGQEFYREIIEFTYSKIQTTYLEVKLQFVYNVLESDEWYNGNINHHWFKGNIGMDHDTRERGRDPLTDENHA
jgi:hypothetical protein